MSRSGRFGGGKFWNIHIRSHGKAAARGIVIFVSRKGAKIFKMAAQPLKIIDANGSVNYWIKNCPLNNLCAFA
jgi:hypothetical protein